MDEVSLPEMQARLIAAVSQRNDALDRCVVMNGTIMMLQEKVRELTPKPLPPPEGP